MKEKNKFQTLKAVIYARYSSDNQREESIEGQLRECMEYAKHNDITVVTTYIDRALSAKTDNRPEFQRMIKDSAKQIFDLVIVWKLDRFSRDRYDSAHYKRILKKNGVKVMSAKETISEGSEGILLEAMLEGYAEYYSVELAEKVKRGLKENALKGKANGGLRTFGYYVDKDRKMQIEPATAAIVTEVFQMYADGKKMKEIVDILNARGVKTNYSKAFSINAVQRMLSNRKYMGEYQFGDVVIPDAVPALVSKEIFEKVEAMLVKNKRAPSRHKSEDDYLLTLKLFCGKCGAIMNGESGTSHTNTTHRYYKCVNTRKKACDKRAVKKDLIERRVIEALMKFLKDDGAIDRLAESLFLLQSKESSKIPRLQEQLAETIKMINNLINAAMQGFVSESSTAKLKELEDTKKKQEIAILEEQIRKPLLTQEQIAFGIYKYRKLDLSTKEGKQKLIDGLVNAIYVYDGNKIGLVCNYKEGTEIISLDEATEGFGSDGNSLTPPH